MKFIRHHAKQFRQGKTTAQKVKQAAKKARETTAKTVRFVARHWKKLLIFGGALLLLILLMAGIASCASMLGGGMNTVIASSYTAEDVDILGAEADYTALESQLTARIDKIESEFPGYDEYVYDIAAIGHDPFMLASYLTAKFHSYTRAEVQAELAALFAQQYTLTLTPVVEIRKSISWGWHNE